MKYWLGLLMLLVGCVVAILVSDTRDSKDPRERAVEEAFEAFAAKDADALYELMGEEEKKHVDRSAFGRYLKEYVLEGIGDLSRVGESSVSPLPTGSEFYSATQDFRGGFRFSFSSRLIGGEPEIDSMVHTLFFARMNHELDNVPLPPTRERVRHLIERLRSEKAELESLGIDGFFFGGSENRRYVTIDEYIKSREAALEKSR